MDGRYVRVIPGLRADQSLFTFNARLPENFSRAKRGARLSRKGFRLAASEVWIFTQVGDGRNVKVRMDANNCNFYEGK